MRADNYEVIKILNDHPKTNIKAGDVGVIIAVFDKPDEAYEVEFSNIEGEPIAQIVLKRKEFDLI